MATSLTLPPALRSDDDDRATALVSAYFDSTGTGRYYTGAFFDRLDGGGDRPGVRNRFTGADLVAVHLLSIRVSRRMGIELEQRAADFEELLSLIPHDVDLAYAHASLISKDSAAWQLWGELKTVHGVDWVVANKLLARKRPRLLPVYDNDVRALVGEPDGFWEALCSALSTDEQALHRRLLAIRERAGVGDDVSVLRVFDVIAWMEAQELKRHEGD